MTYVFFYFKVTIGLTRHPTYGHGVILWLACDVV